MDKNCPLEHCPHCGGMVIWDYFEEEFMYWCGDCGKDLNAEVMEVQNGSDEDWPSYAIPRTERVHRPYGLSRMG